MAKNKLSETLKRLMFEKDIRAVELARQTNLPQPTVQRMVVGTTPNPQLSSLEPIAKFFGISIDQLRGNEPITWLQTAVSANLTQVPIITWEQAQNWAAIRENFQAIGHPEFIWGEKKINPHAFALRLIDASMQPIFPKGTLIIIDPDKTPTDRNYVVATLKKENETVFRQILTDGKNRYLKALSPDLITLPPQMLTPEDKVCGVVVQIRQDFE